MQKSIHVHHRALYSLAVYLVLFTFACSAEPVAMPTASVVPTLTHEPTNTAVPTATLTQTATLTFTPSPTPAPLAIGVGAEWGTLPLTFVADFTDVPFLLDEYQVLE